MKKVIGFLVAIIVIVGAIIAGKFLNLKGADDIYRYIPANAKEAISINLNNEDSEYLYENSKDYQKIKLYLKSVRRLVVVPEMETLSKESLERILQGKEKNGVAIYAQTALSKSALETGIEKISSDDFKVEKLDNDIYRLDVKLNKESLVLFGKIKGGNLILNTNKEKLEENLKNVTDKVVSPLVTDIKANEEKDIVLVVGPNKIFEKAPIQIKSLVASNYFKGDKFIAESKFNLVERQESVINQFFSEEDGLSGKRTVEKNKIYLRSKYPAAMMLKFFLPSLELNDPGVTTGEKIDVKKDEFLYAILEPEKDVTVRVSGIVNTKEIVLEASMDKKEFLKIMKEGRGEELLKKEMELLLER